MKKMTEAWARVMAKARLRAAGFGDRVRSERLERRFLVIVTPKSKHGAPYGAECSEREYTKLLGKSKKVLLLWRSRAMEVGREKGYTREFPPVPFGQSARSAFRTDWNTE